MQYNASGGLDDTDFTYDTLDRLTEADYSPTENEVFTMDQLGNRTNVNLKSGSNEIYDVNSLTNRYTAIAGQSMEYDNAGNTTKDHRGYSYEYDYENRITKITKPGDTVVEYAYDALSRRILKKEDANETRYYNNHNWQVIAEANQADVIEKTYVYGNFIDEVLMMKTDEEIYYYTHDHLYSTASLIDSTGIVVERYKYDAYGKATIMDWSYNTRTESQYVNTYLFTGRTLDTLDDGNLKVQYNRNRYYDPETGRWLTKDPLGITPNPESPNIWSKLQQYDHGLNIYLYAEGNPLIYEDQFGLKSCKGDKRRPPGSDIIDFDFFTKLEKGYKALEKIDETIEDAKIIKKFTDAMLDKDMEALKGILDDIGKKALKEALGKAGVSGIIVTGVVGGSEIGSDIGNYIAKNIGELKAKMDCKACYCARIYSYGTGGFPNHNVIEVESYSALEKKKNKKVKCYRDGKNIFAETLAPEKNTEDWIVSNLIEIFEKPKKIWKKCETKL